MKRVAGEVGDDEQLYRHIRESVAGQLCFQTVGNRVVFSQAAFNDPKKEPSVDRASIRRDPELARSSLHDGIVSLRANAIRKLGPIPQLNNRGKAAKDEQGRPIEFGVNVISDPLWGNCSHALIVMDPASTGAGAFKRLKDALARLASDAGWTIQPNKEPLRQPENAFTDAFRCIGNRLAGRI